MGLILRMTCDHPFAYQYQRSWFFRTWKATMHQCLACGAEIAWRSVPRATGIRPTR